MPAWLLPVLTTALLGVLVGLVAWIGRSFDRRLTAFEDVFNKSMSELKLIVDRGERHEVAIAKLQESVEEMRVDLARWGVN